MDLRSKTVCWVDNGLFVDFCAKCAPAFKRTLYWTPWASSFPKSNSLLVGEGLDGIERIRYLWDYVDEVDLWIFPDIYFGDVATQLSKMGKRVWSARHGDDLELYRDETKEMLKNIGLPVAPWYRIVGLDALREHLKKHDNQWVKVSTVRGDFETFNSQTYDLIEPRLDELEWKLGAKKRVYEFIVEDAIEDVVEVGYDGWVVDGEYPEESMTAAEIKDCGMLGTRRKYEDLAEPVRIVNEALRPFFRKEKYRGFFASEIRVGQDNVPYLIDPCTRCGTPSNELLQELYGNWPEIFWNGGEGKIIKPEPMHKYGALAMIHSAWCDKNWGAIQFPEEIRQYVKLRNHMRMNGKDYVVPGDVGLPEIGAVCGVGETIMEAVEHLCMNASKIKGFQVEIKLDSIGKGMEAFERAEEFGVPFTDDKLPDKEELNRVVEEMQEA